MEAAELRPLVELHRERVRQPHDCREASELSVFEHFESLGLKFEMPDPMGRDVAHVSVDLLYAAYVIAHQNTAFAGKKQFSRYLKKYLVRNDRDFGLGQVLKWQVPIQEGFGMKTPPIDGTTEQEQLWVLWQARDSRDRVFLLRGVTASNCKIPRSALLLFHLSKQGY